MAQYSARPLHRHSTQCAQVSHLLSDSRWAFLSKQIRHLNLSVAHNIKRAQRYYVQKRAVFISDTHRLYNQYRKHISIHGTGECVVHGAKKRATHDSHTTLSLKFCFLPSFLPSNCLFVFKKQESRRNTMSTTPRPLKKGEKGNIIFKN